jgi:DNA-binding response OmpR family regulator
VIPETVVTFQTMTPASDEIRTGDDQNVITVLLVDDQRFIGMAVGRLLASEADIRLHCCYAASEAMAQAILVAPALILQDLVMPDGDGLTLVGLFRANPATARIPVIVLSGTDDPATRARALAAGADDYMVKLPNKAALVESIRAHARNRPESGALSPQPSSASSDVTFDHSMLDAMREATSPDGTEFVTRLVERFLEEASAMVERVSDAARSQDAAVLKASAHRLRGASSTIGARRLGTLAGRVEDHADRRPAVAVDAGLVTALADELTRVRTECLRDTDGVSRPASPHREPL